tara:strand:+ start:2643 stop:3755 length:1113 start_codon:yes stop_codon:yes gene_type:complete
MIDVKKLVDQLKNDKINFFTGVPDSVLKNFTNYIDTDKKCENLILTNEGSAVATGIGYYLSTKKIPAVYMQNSGLGNSLNPLISISHEEVYKIPLLLIIGWRGAPKIKDEPQHLAQGKITRQILDLCGIKNCIIENNKDLLKLKKLIIHSKKNKKIVACLIKNNSLVTEKKNIKKDIRIASSFHTRASFVDTLLKSINKNYKIVSSTGYISRELYGNVQKNKLNINPFYMVGGMGHTSSVSLGYSLKTKKKVICLDGDGSFLMHLGSAVSISSYSKNNFKYILLNNNSHESVGGQITNISNMNLKLFSKSLGYKKYFLLSKRNETKNLIKSFLKCDGPVFLEVKIRINESENKLPRPKDLLKVKKDFLSK